MLAAIAAAPRPTVTAAMQTAASVIPGVGDAGGLHSLAEGLWRAGIALTPLKPADAEHSTIETRAHRGAALSMVAADAIVAVRAAWAAVSAAAATLTDQAIRDALKALFNPLGGPAVYGTFKDRAKHGVATRATLVPLARIPPPLPALGACGKAGGTGDGAGGAPAAAS